MGGGRTAASDELRGPYAYCLDFLTRALFYFAGFYLNYPRHDLALGRRDKGPQLSFPRDGANRGKRAARAVSNSTLFAETRLLYAPSYFLYAPQMDAATQGDEVRADRASDGSRVASCRKQSVLVFTS